MGSYFDHVALQCAIYSIASLGLYITVLSGQWSIAHGTLMGVGAYCAGVLARDLGWDFGLTLAAGALAGAAFGALICGLTLRLRALFLVIVTVVVAQAVVGAVENAPALGGPVGLYPVPIRTTPEVAYLFAALAIALVWWLDRSNWGYRARAVQSDNDVAAALGISVVSIRLQGFVIGGALAGLGGALNIQYTGVMEPAELGFFASLQLFIYITIGGINSWLGPVLGATLFTVLLEFLRFSDTLRFALLGLVLLVIMLVRPTGIIQRRPMKSPRRERWERMSALELWFRRRLWLP